MFLPKAVNEGHNGENWKAYLSILTFPREGCQRKISTGFVWIGGVQKCFEDQRKSPVCHFF